MTQINTWKIICSHCHTMPIDEKSVAAKYGMCENCFFAEGFSSPATRINKRFGVKNAKTTKEI